MDIDDFKPTTVYTIYIASTPERVWEALTRSKFSRKYFFGNSVEVGLRLGGAYIVRTPDGALHISGEVIECAAPRKLTVTFNVNWPELAEKLGQTLVSYEIEEAGEAVRLTMTESHDRALDDDTVRKRFIDLGCDIPDKAARGREPLAAVIKRDIALWTPIIKAANVKGE